MNYSPNASAFLGEVQAMENPRKAEACLWFFKTGKGGYGEGDRFWGLTVPMQRKLSTAWYKRLELADLELLLRHDVHEVRLTTLMMMVLQYKKSKSDAERTAIKDAYLVGLDYVNNWDLVDSSAHLILGEWLVERDRDILFELARKDHLWSQRVSIIATIAFIKRNDFATTLQLAVVLLHHRHDLIHKAVGWMLREVGNRAYQTEYEFLKQHYSTMPRTMLRYAIEKFPESIRQDFLKGNI